MHPNVKVDANLVPFDADSSRLFFGLVKMKHGGPEGTMANKAGAFGEAYCRRRPSVSKSTVPAPREKAPSVMAAMPAESISKHNAPVW